jgi:hypothetical protein
MTAAEYTRKRMWLLEVLKDATDRGDIYLEYDVKEQLVALQDAYYENEEGDEE